MRLSGTRPRDRLAALVVMAQVFLGGAAVMTLELLGSRLLAPRFGSTLYVWGSLIGVVMTGLALGAWAGGRLADKRPRLSALSQVVFLAGLSVVLVASASRLAMDLLDGLPLTWGPLVASLALLGPPSLLLGMATPFAVRLQATAIPRVGNTVGGVSALSTAGSIAGTFATVFVLVPRFPVPTLMLALAVGLLALGVAGMERRALAAALAVAALVVSPATGNAAERWVSSGVETLAYRTIHEADTPYHHLEVLEARGGTERRLVLDGLLHSSTWTDRPNETSAEYVSYFHLGAALKPNLTDVLFIGAGGFSAPKKFLEAYPDARLDVVEIDPEVVRVADEYFFAPVDDPRVRVFIDDGRRFLAQADRAYDLIVLDAYGRDYVPFHLMTAEFFFELRDRLAPGGVVASNLIASTSGRASEILAAEVKTMEQAFREVYVFPVGGARGVVPQNVVVLATDDAVRRDAARLLRDAEAIAQPAVPDVAAHARHLHEGLDTYGAPILRDDFAPVEILLNPVTNSPFQRA